MVHYLRINAVVCFGHAQLSGTPGAKEQIWETRSTLRPRIAWASGPAHWLSATPPRMFAAATRSRRLSSVS